MICFIKQFIKEKLENIDDLDSLEKTFKKKIFYLLNEMIIIFINENEKLSLLIFMKCLFGEEISIYLTYKLVSLIYKFDRRGNLF